MCGIVGFLGKSNGSNYVFKGLQRLEYRGYDSIGISYLDSSYKTNIVKEKGSYGDFYSKNEKSLISIDFGVGIGHTRWATHGKPSKINAHPHISKNNNFSIIHNGIIENFKELKKQLKEKGKECISETDTEVVVHLLEKEEKNNKNTFEAFNSVISKLKGAYSIVIISNKNPNKLYLARKGSPLLVGKNNKNDWFVSSDASAFVEFANEYAVVDDYNIIELTLGGSYICKNIKNENLLKLNFEKSELKAEDIGKNGYSHFMLKEIFEQDRSVENSFLGRIFDNKVSFESLKEISKEKILNANRIKIIACGTSYNSGLVGEYYFENISKVDTEVDIASEFRYRNPIINKNDLLIFISQSGETTDTLAALEEAKRLGAYVIGICNVWGSSLSRQADDVIYINAGPEIGVASTKAFTSQVVVLLLLSCYIAQNKKHETVSIIKGLVDIKKNIKSVLNRNSKIETFSKLFNNVKGVFFLGRGINYPIALEGALKMKEISYLNCNGLPAGELKHGPIALIEKDFLSVVIATSDNLIDKVISNIQEIKARTGEVLIITYDEYIYKFEDLTSNIISIPKTEINISSITTTIVLQLLSFYVANSFNLEIDKPRNLAKSVTVE